MLPDIFDTEIVVPIGEIFTEIVTFAEVGAEASITQLFNIKWMT